ncbi:fluoride efflux transporter FluC [Actinoplanes sp. CA-030573]|uniref:fluoride efflux transporter FluC n=1 Tax=Actinoplanes sp. CA-030573 TaxID=3239898 RepID=UPI003D8D6B88
MDPDVDLHVPRMRDEMRPSPWPVLAAISAGGVVGALSRYALALAWPHPAGGFAWSTLVTNVSGCFLIGVLMVIVDRGASRLLRPFAGVGVLGGFTTFSTYAVDAQRAAQAGRPGTALAYLAVTLVTALLAVWAGSALTTRLTGTPTAETA